MALFRVLTGWSIGEYRTSPQLVGLARVPQAAKLK
jgi:hypothetical protein